MTIQEINDLIAENNLDRLKEFLQLNYDLDGITKALKQYIPQEHDIHDPNIRKAKTIKNDAGQVTNIVEPTRLSIPLQKKITLISAAMLGNPEIECDPTNNLEQSALDIQQKIWDDNKLDFKFMRTKEITMSEKACAELWFTVDAEDGYWDGYNISSKLKLKMKLLAHSLGDTLYPVYDMYGDMIAFARGYLTIEDGKEVDHLDLYTPDRFYFNKKVDGQWVGNYSENFVPQMDVDTNTQFIPNQIGKIPIIYYYQAHTEWRDVQEMIDRLEKKISNHADTNDRFDSPIMVTECKIDGFSDKDDTGKLLEGEAGSKVMYLTWDNAPESMKMEIDNLFKLIYSMTSTPDISFENLKNLGYFSTIALKTMFMDAHMKASKHEAMFGEMVQRRMNFIKQWIAVMAPAYKPTLRLKMTPKFTYFMPKDLVETVNMLSTAVMGGILSAETATNLTGLVGDGQEEWSKIQGEKSAAQEAAQGAAGLDTLMNQ